MDIKVMKSEEFAVAIIAFCKLLDERKEFSISNQLLRSGTSVGANIAESTCAESEADFIHKLRISVKECRETKFWLRIIGKSGIASHEEIAPLYNQCEDLMRILLSILKKKSEGC